MTNREETKDKFYEELNTVITDLPNGDKLIILGDPRDNVSWEGVIGKYGVGNCNSNGLLLV